MNSWITAADSTIEHLASHPSSRPDLTFLAQYDNRTLDKTSGHLACFDGGNFILGGLVLDEQKYIDFGLQLVEGCEDTYNQVSVPIYVLQSRKICPLTNAVDVDGNRSRVFCLGQLFCASRSG